MANKNNETHESIEQLREKLDYATSELARMKRLLTENVRYMFFVCLIFFQCTGM